LLNTKRLTPRAPDKCGALPALSGILAQPRREHVGQAADSASGGFARQFPPLRVTPGSTERSER